MQVNPQHLGKLVFSWTDIFRYTLLLEYCFVFCLESWLEIGRIHFFSNMKAIKIFQWLMKIGPLSCVSIFQLIAELKASNVMTENKMRPTFYPVIDIQVPDGLLPDDKWVNISTGQAINTCKNMTSSLIAMAGMWPDKMTPCITLVGGPWWVGISKTKARMNFYIYEA